MVANRSFRLNDLRAYFRVTHELHAWPLSCKTICVCFRALLDLDGGTTCRPRTSDQPNRDWVHLGEPSRRAAL